MAQDEFNDIPSSENPETDYIIDPIDKESLSYGLYSKMVNYENHHNMIQHKYKGMTITWLFATFIGIGYLLAGYEARLSIEIELIIAFLCLLSAEGIALIWFLDIGVTYSSIVSIFMEIKRFENNHKELGSSHKNILKLHKKTKDPERFHGFFYMIFILSLVSIAIILLSLFLKRFGVVFMIIGDLAVLVVVTLLTIGIFRTGKAR